MTIHQRPFGWLWHWKTGPGWCRDGREIRKLYDAGMKVLRVQLQDDGPIPVEQAQEWRDAGVKVWGAVGHVDGRVPEGLAAWMKAERVRLSLTGLELNGEEDVRAMDAASSGQWSATFASELRRLAPTLPLVLDSYFGPLAGGIHHAPYLANGFRVTMQSYWDTGVWNDPPTRMVEQWRAGGTLGAQPPIPKANIKPLHRVVRPDTGPDAGKLPDWDVVFRDHKASGCLAFGLYHIDGADFDLLLWLFRESVRRGCAL